MAGYLKVSSIGSLTPIPPPLPQQPPRLISCTSMGLGSPVAALRPASVWSSFQDTATLFPKSQARPAPAGPVCLDGRGRHGPKSILNLLVFMSWGELAGLGSAAGGLPLPDA